MKRHFFVALVTLFLMTTKNMYAQQASTMPVDSAQAVKAQQQIEKDQKAINASQDKIEKNDKKKNKALAKAEKKERKMNKALRKANRQEKRKEKEMRKLQRKEEKLNTMKTETPTTVPNP